MLEFLKPRYSNERPGRNKQTTSVQQTIPLVPIESDYAKVVRTVSYRQIGKIGRVSFQGVSWPALCIQESIYSPGTLVKVRYRRGNTLIVDATAELHVQQVA